jgi:molybdate transport system substrate-binding protein
MPLRRTMTAMRSTTITGISSMATRALLADLVAAQALPVAIESVGGVDAAQRVHAGEAFDVVVLASDAIDKLVAAGRVLAGSKVDLVQSGVAVAVKAGAVHPDIASEDAVRRAVLAATTLGYSTGPSGVQLAKLFERWGISQEIAPRIVTAPPGVPVGSLVARGDVALGFQQLSELMGLQGLDVLGPLPPSIQITTTFSAGVCAASAQPEAARALLAFLASPKTAETKQRHGMEPA